MQRGNASVMAGANSWKDQIFEAFTVQAGKCPFLKNFIRVFLFDFKEWYTLQCIRMYFFKVLREILSVLIRSSA